MSVPVLGVHTPQQVMHARGNSLKRLSAQHMGGLSAFIAVLRVVTRPASRREPSPVTRP